MALLTSDLHTVMKNDPTFLSLFALDKVHPIIKKGNVKLIINLDPATKPGSHWVAFGEKEILGIIMIVLAASHHQRLGRGWLEIVIRGLIIKNLCNHLRTKLLVVIYVFRF